MYSVHTYGTCVYIHTCVGMCCMYMCSIHVACVVCVYICGMCMICMHVWYMGDACSLCMYMHVAYVCVV